MALHVPLKDEPIMSSFLDTDDYKLTMAQWIYHRYPDVAVRYAFTNRSPRIRLADTVDESELRVELDHFMTLRPIPKELEYLRSRRRDDGQSLFKEDYLKSFETLELPPYHLESRDGQLILEFSGPWSTAVYWEVPALAIVNELHNKSLMRGMTDRQRAEVYNEGHRRLVLKTAAIRKRGDLYLVEFGTRRRSGQPNQEHVVGFLAHELPEQLLGTSNVNLAMKYGLDPKGTMAHELFMGMSGIMHSSREEIRASQKQVLDEWFDEYGSTLAIILDDTYGTDAMLRDLSPDRVMKWKGFRPDSGDPIDVGEKWYDLYRRFGIDPEEKMGFPSDGVNLDVMIRVVDHFAGRLPHSFGVGTWLSNDMGLIEPIPIVIKLVESNGFGTVKLSNNLAKATGKPEDINLFKEVFDYTNTYYEKVKY